MYRKQFHVHAYIYERETAAILYKSNVVLFSSTLYFYTQQVKGRPTPELLGMKLPLPSSLWRESLLLQIRRSLVGTAVRVPAKPKFSQNKARLGKKCVSPDFNNIVPLYPRLCLIKVARCAEKVCSYKQSLFYLMPIYVQIMHTNRPAALWLP